MFTKSGCYLGDTWYFVQADCVHMYYLVCPKSVKRHTRWSIAHAVSKDLVDWKDLGIVLEPGEADSWDGLTLATGSIIEFNGRFYLAYSGNFAGPRPAVGLAVSEDLHVWKKLPDNPVTSSDGIFYSTAPNQVWNQPRWRDPFLFREGDQIYQLVCAARNGVSGESTGTVALAVTSDMNQWELLPPMDVPAIAQDLECPKLSKIENRYYLTVSISDSLMGEHLRSRQPASLPVSTAYTLVSDSLSGPYSFHGSGRILETDSWGAPYACEPVFFKGQYFMFGTIWNDGEPDIVTDPIPIEATSVGFRAIVG